MLRLIIAIGSIVLLSAAGTTALERPSIKACDSDLKQSCAGEKAPLKCLKTNYNAVSESCKDFVRAAVVSKVCAQDIKTFCSGILPDRVKFADCMTRKWEKISDTCQPYLLVYPTDKKWGTMSPDADHRLAYAKCLPVCDIEADTYYDKFVRTAAPGSVDQERWRSNRSHCVSYCKRSLYQGLGTTYDDPHGLMAQPH